MAISRAKRGTSKELTDTADQFRRRDIPIDCIVQDWLYWEDGLWGEKKVDRGRYPDLKELIDDLHKKQVKLMVSIWPNMAEGCKNLDEFREKDLLLPNSTVYNAYAEEARELYWRQCEEEWFTAGADAWWCDSSEPFTDPDWCGEEKKADELRYRLIAEESRKSMDWTRTNSYGLLHSKGIYDNWRKSDSKKRVVNLTRSSYISGQKYGVVVWSGDTSAKWATLKTQITEGIQFSLCGMPYWTLDIGGFFTVKDKYENRGCGSSGNTSRLWFWDGDYNDGAEDLGYRELYVRWFQYAVFLPMLRAHGTDTSREPWRFGEPGEIFYETIVKFIHLRYRLLPYIYSMGAMVYQRHFTMLRSLLFDFASDETVKEISDCFLFGNAFLVCPVTEPMYYQAGSIPIERSGRTRKVYLPGGTAWYDYWTEKYYEGGQYIEAEVPLDIIPLFVRAGSIIPVSEAVGYSGEKGGEVSQILIYTGKDGRFTLYNDEGDNYSYETGNYAAIPLNYKEEEQTLTFERAEGHYPCQENFRIRVISFSGSEKIIEVLYRGEEMVIQL